MVYSSLRYLNVSSISPRALRHESVVKLSAFSLFEYCMSLRPGNSFVALLFTASNAHISPRWCGLQTACAYSSLGRTRPLYRNRKVSESRCSNNFSVCLIDDLRHMQSEVQLGINCHFHVLLGRSCRDLVQGVYGTIVASHVVVWWVSAYLLISMN